MRTKIAVCLLAACAAVARADKVTISVMDLNVTSGVSAGEAVMLTDKLLNELVNNGAYKVVERSKRDEILKEQGFQQTGACDQGRCLVEAGQLLGVQKMVGGTIGRLGEVYAVELRVMDVKTGEIDRAFSRKYKGDVSKLLDAMQEAAAYFSGNKYKIAVKQETTAVKGMIYLQTNAQGYKEYRNMKDGSILIEIPEGVFTMGSDESNNDEKPAHDIFMDAYFIGKYEVTIGQYRNFADETGYKGNTGEILIKNGDGTINDDLPVSFANWKDAKTYCDWAGLRLPTEAEWEKAARSIDCRMYPWGNDWDPLKCNSLGSIDGFYYLAPVGHFTSGASPYGCLDMIGNVWEWCNDWYDKYYYSKSLDNSPKGSTVGPHRVMRGGSCRDGDAECNATKRNGKGWTRWDKKYGFRVAK